MNRLRHAAALLLVTAFTAFQLLASAPLLHSHCENLETLAQAKHQREAPAFRPLGQTLPQGTEECPVCMVSGLSAILSPGLAVLAPSAHVAAAPVPADAAVRSSRSESLRSRAPPAV
jgi:hypothetical protein